MQPGQTIRLTLRGGDNETLEGVFILDPMLINPDDPSLNQPLNASTTEEPYDQEGAMAYAVVVILVYGCSIIFLIASHIFLKKKEHKKDQDDGQIDKYLEQIPSLKDKSARESFRKLKYSIIPLVAMAPMGLPGAPRAGEGSSGQSGDGTPKVPPSPLPSIAEIDETDDPNEPLISSPGGTDPKDKKKPNRLTIPVYDHQVSLESPRPSPRAVISPVDEGKCPWEVDESRRGSPRPFSLDSGSRGPSPQPSPRTPTRGLSPSPSSTRRPRDRPHVLGVTDHNPICLSIEDLTDPEGGIARERSSGGLRKPAGAGRFPSPTFSLGGGSQHLFGFRPITCTSGSSSSSPDSSREHTPEAEELVHVTCV